MRHYIELTQNQNFIVGENHFLPVHHITVLRRKISDTIILFDGKGNSCEAVLENITKQQATARVFKILNSDIAPNVIIELAQCLPTMEKMDWIIEKFTELGGHILTVLEGQKNTVRLNEERAMKKISRWQELLIASCTQCERNYLPKVHHLQTTEKYFLESNNSEQENFKHVKILLSPTGTTSLMSILNELNSLNKLNINDKNNQSQIKITVAVGPESGFSEKEVILAQKNNWIIASLGNAILRTETVGLTAITLIQGVLGEFSE